MELKVDGRRVYAATGGRAFDPAQPTVAFVHGAAMDHTVWQLPARWFAWHRHSVLAVDLPGHGRSEGPILRSVPELAQWLGRAMDAAGSSAPPSSAIPWAGRSRWKRPPRCRSE
jgi:pimeloyl-ACP methyl ester carboxylesterase